MFRNYMNMALLYFGNVLVWSGAYLARLFQMRNGNQKQRIVLIANDLLGDSLVRMPFYRQLRIDYPNSEIVLMVQTSFCDLYARLPYFDKVIGMPVSLARHPFFWIFKGNLGFAFRNSTDVLVNFVRVRLVGHDYIVKWMRPKRSVAYVSRAASFGTAFAHYQKNWTDRYYTRLLPYVDGRSQIADMDDFYSFVFESHRHLSLVPRKELEDALAMTSTFRYKKPLRYYALVPGASSRMRYWPVERFAEVVRRLCVEDDQLQFVVVGTHKEAMLGEKIKEVSPSKIINLCGKTTLSELGSVLIGANLVVTNETGTATYAAILGTPTVCIVGGGDFGAFFPNSFYRNTQSVYANDDCFGCHWHCRKSARDDTTAPCIARISVEDVLSVIHRISSDVA